MMPALPPPVVHPPPVDGPVPHWLAQYRAAKKIQKGWRAKKKGGRKKSRKKRQTRKR